MDEALTTDLPAAELVEILVASRATPGPHRDPRLVLVAGAVVASIAFGLAAHVLDGGRVADPRHGNVAESESPATGAGPQGGGDSSTTRDVVLVGAAEGKPVRGATVVVAGSARESHRDTWLGVRFGRLVLGGRSADLDGGQFSVAVPVFAPRVPVTAAMEVRASGPDGPLLASTTSPLASGSAVDVWSISTAHDGDECRITATGPAPVAVGIVSASVTDRGVSIAASRATIAAASDSPAGASLHLGRWRFETSVPSSRAPAVIPGDPAPLRLELAWHDPSDGTSSELSVPFVACPAGR